MRKHIKQKLKWYEKKHALTLTMASNRIQTSLSRSLEWSTSEIRLREIRAVMYVRVRVRVCNACAITAYSIIPNNTASDRLVSAMYLFIILVVWHCVCDRLMLFRFGVKSHALCNAAIARAYHRRINQCDNFSYSPHGWWRWWCEHAIFILRSEKNKTRPFPSASKRMKELGEQTAEPTSSQHTWKCNGEEKRERIITATKIFA